MAWAEGQSLYGGRYRIAKVLGLGGFGIAYLAYDLSGRPVVIKTLKDEVFLDQKQKYFCDRFKEEALRLAVCRHPHIVTIENFFEEPYMVKVGHKKLEVNVFCLVMEFIDGETLVDLVRRRGPLPENEALTYIRQIASALSAVHKLGVLHRDIKPSNIMVRSGKPEAVLIDFGLARNFVPDAERNYTVAMTHGYAPPEQYSSKAVASEAMDVYALSATLYFALTRQIPAPAMDRMLSSPLIPPEKFNPNLSEAVVTAIYRGMELKLEQRSPSMAKWLELLPEPTGFTVAPPPPPLPRKVSAVASVPSPKTNSLRTLSQHHSRYYSKPKPRTITIDLQKLDQLLAHQEWQKADLETAHIIQTLAHREAEGWLSVDSIKSIPSQTLFTLDRLWNKYSGGKFGFRVQKQIWESVGGGWGVSEYEVAKKFGDRVGWTSKTDKEEWLPYSELSFLITAPQGHLPSWRCGGQKVAGWVAGRLGFFLARWR
jgi:serine/threonine protein kinase